MSPKRPTSHDEKVLVQSAKQARALIADMLEEAGYSARDPIPDKILLKHVCPPYTTRINKLLDMQERHHPETHPPRPRKKR